MPDCGGGLAAAAAAAGGAAAGGGAGADDEASGDGDEGEVDEVDADAAPVLWVVAATLAVPLVGGCGLFVWGGGVPECGRIASAAMRTCSSKAPICSAQPAGTPGWDTIVARVELMVSQALSGSPSAACWGG